MAKSFIPLTRTEGRASRQAHARPAGGHLRARGLPRRASSGPPPSLYHTHPPTGWSDFEGPLRPRAFDLNEHRQPHDGPWASARVLGNARCEVRFWRLTGDMDALARNADGDQLLFVHEGTGDLFCDYGHLSVRAGDYVVLPRGTMWRVETEAMAVLMIEATGSHYGLPDKGLVGPHAIFDPAMLDTPKMDEAFRAQQGEDETRVQVKKRGEVSTVTFPFNPLDAVGWHGELAPVRINVEDVRPLMSARYHLPPSAHTTFVADRFVVCTFAPRPFETDPGAIKVPFFHNNDDYDEVLFYHAGDFFSRDGIDAGMMTFHPSGFTHGPHPKALTKMFKQEKAQTDEYAVMIDTRDPLDVYDGASRVERAEYVDSWKPKG